MKLKTQQKTSCVIGINIAIPREQLFRLLEIKAIKVGFFFPFISNN